MWFKRSKKRVMLIGLDCADPRLVFDRWLDDLPNIKRVVEAGAHGPLRSATPPITVPAWMSMMTSQDPGQLGLYGFRNRTDYSYTGMSVANSASIKQRTVWDILGDANKTSIIIGVPPTFPPKPMRGDLIGCFMTPSIDQQYTYPASLSSEVQKIAGEYLVDVKGFRTPKKEWLLDQIYQMTERRFKVAKHLLERRNWDFFAMVEMGVDRIHHGFWQFMDPEHVLYEPGSPFENAIYEYYKYIDRWVGELLDHADENTLIMIVSDHGAKRMDGAICINEWLVQKGYLALKSYPQTPTRFEDLDVDWERTSAWGEGGYYGRVFINVKGREPNGIVRPEDYDAFRQKLVEELEALGDESGRPIGTRAVKPEQTYSEVRNIPSDLVVFFGDLYWRSVGSVGTASIHTRENDTGPDGANHDWNGIFIMASGREFARGERRVDVPTGGLQLMDVSPTILNHFGITPEPRMRGRIVPARAVAPALAG